MPVQVMVGEKNLKEGNIEIKLRETGERMKVKLDELYVKLRDIL